MARPVDERKKRLAALERRFKTKDPRPLELNHRTRPAWPPEAFYFRRYATFEDAMKAYAANRTPPRWAGVETVQAVVRERIRGPVMPSRPQTVIKLKHAFRERPRAAGAISESALVPVRRRAVAAIVGSDEDPDAILERAYQWCTPHLLADASAADVAERDVAAEIMLLVPRLHALYHAPVSFFAEAARAWPDAFSGLDRFPDKLGNLLFTWGPAVLLWQPARDAFFRVTSARRNAILAEAEGRTRWLPDRVSDRDFGALSRAYYALPRGTKARWIEREAARQPVISTESLLRAIRKAKAGRVSKN